MRKKILIASGVRRQHSEIFSAFLHGYLAYRHYWTSCCLLTAVTVVSLAFGPDSGFVACWWKVFRVFGVSDYCLRQEKLRTPENNQPLNCSAAPVMIGAEAEMCSVCRNCERFLAKCYPSGSQLRMNSSDWCNIREGQSLSSILEVLIGPS